MTILQTLKNHYQDALLSHARLGGLPKIEKEDWSKMSVLEAQELLDWTLSQKWEFEQDVIYDWICGLHSPSLTILFAIVENGFALHPSASMCDENKVLFAHVCVGGVRCKKLPQEFKSYIIQGVTEGDPLLLVMDFQQWIEDLALTDLVLQRIAGVDESGLMSSSPEVLAYNLIDSLEDNGESDKEYCQWLEQKFNEPWFASVLAIAAPCIWSWGNKESVSYTPEQIQRLHQRTQKFFQTIPANTMDQAIAKEMVCEGDAKYLDSLMPLLPDSMQKHHMHNTFFDNQPYTHQLRFNQRLKDSVECFGALTASRKM